MVSNYWRNCHGLFFVVIFVVLGLSLRGLLIFGLSLRRAEMSFNVDDCSEVE